MITAKQLNGTHPHQQMRLYIDTIYPDKGAADKAGYLSSLVKKFLFNFENDPHGGLGAGPGDPDILPDNITNAFIWGDTPEGHEFWLRVSRMEPVNPVQDNNPWVEWDAAPKVKKAKGKAAAPKAPPKKQIGWWH